MIRKDDCMNFILDKVPEFKTAWQVHLDFWGEDEAGLSNDIAEFASFIISNIVKMDDEKKKNIFRLVEDCLNDGDEFVKDAIATCFLENLLNAVSDKKLSSESFIHFLGGKSRAYCKSWDEFTGVQTPNL
jgi:hypothetical protein